MNLLALECSSNRRSTALVSITDGRPRVLAEAIAPGGRSTRIFALIESVLQQAAIEREQVEAIAVGLGPGSYTGIRASIAVAQGWAAARPIRLAGVASVEALAAQAARLSSAGRVNIIIDAQRSEFCLARYALGTGQAVLVDSLQVVTSDQVQQFLDRNEMVMGPEASEYFSGAQDLFPSAADLGVIAAQRQNWVAAEQLAPIYLRETAFVRAPEIPQPPL